MEKVKGVIDQPMWLPADCRHQGLEVRDAMFVLNDDLAIKDCRSALKIGGSLNHTRITFAPIEAIAGIGAGLTSLDNKERAVSVMLDLVNPTTPQRRLFDEGSELRFDEAKYAAHAKSCSKAGAEIGVQSADAVGTNAPRIVGEGAYYAGKLGYPAGQLSFQAGRNNKEDR